MSDNSELPQNELPPEPSRIEDTKTGYPYDFWSGFFGALIGNILLYILIFQILPGRIPIRWTNLTSIILPLALNIGAIIWFLINKRPKIVGGILVIASVGFIIVLCLSTGCFGQL